MNNRKKRLLKNKTLLNNTLKETISINVNDKQFLVVNVNENFDRMRSYRLGEMLSKMLNVPILVTKDKLKFSAKNGNDLIDQIKVNMEK